MSDAIPPVESYGVLAESCLAHPAWPASLSPKPRSLAALFSKLDRNIELEWLVDREGVQHVLASLLNCSLQRIRQALEGAQIVHDDGRPVYRFPAAPRARPVELTREPLPPGIPGTLAVPRRWARHWWPASQGDGVPLVAAWLTARGLANVVFASHLRLALERLDPSSPNFVVLENSDDPPDEWPRVPLCVASPRRAPAGFELIGVTPCEERWSELVDWFSLRLPPDGRLDPEFTQNWFERNGELARDFESAIALIALMDELGSKVVESGSPFALAQAFAQRRLADASAPGAGASWMRDNGFAVLLGLARACATQSYTPFAGARTRDEWVDLVPNEFRRGFDVPWAKASLARAGAPISQELDRVMTLAPPGAYRVVADLERAGLLSNASGDLLRPVPSWLVRAVEAHAVQQVALSSVNEWGEAILFGHTEAAIHRVLVERLAEADLELIDAVLELDDAGSPAAAAAVEAVTCALGEALLGGAELDPSTLGSFLELQEKWLVRLTDGRTVPRLGAHDPERQGAFTLGIWAIDQALEGHGDERGGSAARIIDEGALHAALAFLERCGGAAWVYEGYGLLGRIARRHFPAHLAAVPVAVLRDPRWAELSRLPELAHGVAAVRHLCGGADEWAQLSADLWRSWLAAGLPETSLFVGAVELWQYAPNDVLRKLAERSHPLLRVAPLESLSFAQLAALFESARQADWFAWAGLPDSACELALALALRLTDLRGITLLWQRYPDELVGACNEALQYERFGQLALLLDSAPSGQTERLAPLLEAAIAAKGVAHPATESIRRWALKQCSVRGPACRVAYVLLDDIEARLSRVRAARGPH